MHLNDAIEAFIVARKAGRRLRPTTERTYRHHFDRFTEHIGGDTPLDSITTRHLQAWIATMDHLEASSLRTAEAPIRSMFSWAIGEDLIGTDPMAVIPRPKPVRPMYRGLEPDTIARLLHVADFRERTIILLGLHLGLRCVEMSRADVSDWDHRRKVLFVHGKGGSDRALPISGEVEWVLSIWTEGRRAGPLFPSQHAERLSANSISQIITRVSKRAGVQATAHQLRHTCAHDMLAMGAKPNAVQRFLGHTDLTTTAVYLAARDDELRAAMSRHYVIGDQVVDPFAPAA